METKEKRNHQREELDHGIDGKRRVRQRHRYDHHTRRCSKHRRHVKVEDDDDVDIHRDQQPKGRYQSELCKVCRGRVNDASYLGANEIRKRRRKLEELSHDLKEDHNDLPLLLSSSTDSDVVVEWVSLPRDAVFFILDKLLEPIDHVRFAAVSKEWRCVARYYNHTTQRWRKQQALPMLMIPTKFANQQRLYSVSERKIYNNIQLQVSPVPCSDNYFCGSNYGWLASTQTSIEEIIDLENPYGHEAVEVTYRITLRNPFKRAVEAIHLPSLKHRFPKLAFFHPYLVPQVILSADPTLHPENYIVFAFCIHYVTFAFIKGGQEDWVLYKGRVLSANMLDNAIFYKNQVYAIINGFGWFMRADVNNNNNSSEPLEPEILSVTPKLSYCGNSYLVESTEGDLLLVRKFCQWKKTGINKEWGIEWLCTSITFIVYKVVFNDKDESIIELVEMKNIGDDALFLFNSHSMSVLAFKILGCQPNSIYYTSDDARKSMSTQPGRDGKACDMGIFNLDDKTTTPLYSSQDECYWNHYMPLWVLPSFNGLFS